MQFPVKIFLFYGVLLRSVLRSTRLQAQLYLQVLLRLLLLLHPRRHLRHGAADGVQVRQLGQVLQVVNVEGLGRVERPRPEVELGRHGGGCWWQLYKNKSSRKIDSLRLFSR